MSFIRLEGVSAGFDSTVVVNGVDLAIERGTVCGFTGDNGSGKTTLLHTIALLLRPMQGRLLIDGEPVEDAEPFRSKIAVVLQHPYMFRGSVLDNVELGLKVRGVGALQRRQKAQAALELVGMAELSTRPAKALSGGETKRVGLAMALCLEPEILILDEPTENLDHPTRELVARIIAELPATSGVTIITATHDKALLKKARADIWRLENGRVERDVGLNIFTGDVSAEDLTTFRGEKFTISATGLMADTHMVEIDPVDVILSREPVASSARNKLEGRVIGVEECGDSLSLRVTLDCGEPVAALVTRRSWEELGLEVGQTAVATFKATAVKPL